MIAPSWRTGAATSCDNDRCATWTCIHTAVIPRTAASSSAAHASLHWHAAQPVGIQVSTTSTILTGSQTGTTRTNRGSSRFGPVALLSAATIRCAESAALRRTVASFIAVSSHVPYGTGPGVPGSLKVRSGTRPGSLTSPKNSSVSRGSGYRHTLSCHRQQH